MSEDLWSFALKVYARPGVEAACLTLQEAGADVCLLLSCAWLGRRGVTFTEHRLQSLESLAKDWTTAVIQPMRSLRQQWREMIEQAALQPLRERLKALEVEAERCLLARLESLAGAWPDAVSQDLRAWLVAAAGWAGQHHRDALEHLCIAVEVY